MSVTVVPTPEPSRRSSGPTDLELIAEAQTGDDEAFRTLVLRHEGTVAGTVIGMLGPGADAEDVGQEVFIRFYRSMDRFRGDSSLRTYLTRIAINLSLNALKRRARWHQRLTSRDRGDDEVPLDEPAVSGEQTIAARDRERAVHAALLALDTEQRSVATLRLVQGFSTRETADLLEIPEGTVTSRLARARQRLQASLADLLEAR